MSFIDEINEKVKLLRKELDQANTVEKKKAFAQKYGFTMQDIAHLTSLSNLAFGFYSSRDHDYNNGDMGNFYVQEDEVNERMENNVTHEINIFLKKHIILPQLDQITSENINSNLLDTLQEIGYDGKNGSQLIKMCFKFRCNIDGLPERIKSTTQEFNRLKDSYENNSYQLRGLRARDTAYQNCIEESGKYVTNINHQINRTSEYASNLNSKFLKNTFLNKLNRFFGIQDDKYDEMDLILKNMEVATEDAGSICRDAEKNIQSTLNAEYPPSSYEEYDIHSNFRMSGKQIVPRRNSISFDEIQKKYKTNFDYSSPSEETLRFLQKYGYDGKSGPEILQLSYKLFCENENLQQQFTNSTEDLNTLYNSLNLQNQEITSLKSRAQILKNTLNDCLNKLDSVNCIINKNTLYVIASLKNRISYEYGSLLDKISNGISRTI